MSYDRWGWIKDEIENIKNDRKLAMRRTVHSSNVAAMERERQRADSRLRYNRRANNVQRDSKHELDSTDDSLG